MGIKTEEINAGEGRRVTEDFTCPDGTVITTGFEFDGASVPRPLYPICPPFKHLDCSGEHDFKCAIARKYMDESKKCVWPKAAKRWKTMALKKRAEADASFRKCKIKKEGFVIGWILWAGVRIGSKLGIGW